MQMYIYRWKNNLKRATMVNRKCKVVAKGSKNSVCVEFVDNNNQREITSQRALRKII